MLDLDNFIDLLIENVKKLFFPEEWIQLDMKLSKSEVFALLFIDKKKEITMTELGEYINTPMSTATGIVDRLVRNGFVARDRSEADRRIVILRLSEEGKSLIKSLKDVISEYLNMIVEDLTEEEKQFISRIVLKILNSLQLKQNSKASIEQVKEEIKKINIE